MPHTPSSGRMAISMECPSGRESGRDDGGGQKRKRQKRVGCEGEGEEEMDGGEENILSFKCFLPYPSFV